MLNFRLDLCFAHPTPPEALIQRICGPKRAPGNRRFPCASSRSLTFDRGKGLARQGIEPWSTDYETAALPLSYRASGSRSDTTFLNSFGQLFGSLQAFTPCEFLWLAFELPNSNFDAGALQCVGEFLGFRAAIVVGIGNLRPKSFHALRRLER